MLQQTPRVAAVLLILAAALGVLAVDRTNFKTCEQSGFCKRQRNYKPDASPYHLQLDSLTTEHGHLSAQLVNADNAHSFALQLDLLKDDRFRLRIDETAPLKTRYRADSVLVDDLAQAKFSAVEKSKDSVVLRTARGDRAVLYAAPFKLEFYIGEYLVASVNSRQLLKLEHLRLKDAVPAADEQAAANNETANVEQEAVAPPTAEEEHMWEETFKSHTDSKPNGPESIGVDINFHDFEHVFGIPEHADAFALRSTTNTDPYRLYNLDVFEYELNNPMALYASIPYMVAHNTKFTVGVLWLNAAETWVDVNSSAADKSLFSQMAAQFVSKSQEIPQMNTRWMSESGVLDLFVLLGPRPADVFRQLGELVGNTPLPPLFALAYHQCRWNYNDETDVSGVNEGFEEHQIPMDVIWLDIEHTNAKKYFTWDPLKFPTPEQMMRQLSAFGRKMVTIVDPHIKVDSAYHIYTEAKEKSYFVKDKSGNAIDGWCWPGSSSWPDFCDAEVQKWWASKFHLENYPGTTLDTYTWNDMNEPSMFNGPEVTFHKDALHLSGFEHRHLHNLYGQCQMAATFQGHLERSGGERRPFVLTRAAFVGSQRYGAIWTGDNTADWDHLKISLPMLLSLSVSGMGFAGADVGGFFKNVDAELMVRWYQAAAHQPFFRSHAHLDTKRREPWLFGEANMNIIRDAIHARYALLYYWYTLFYLNERNGTPAMLPLWAVFPTERALFAIDDQHMIGEALMIKPVTSAGATSIDVLFPGRGELWYDVKAMRTFEGGSTKTFLDINLSTIPIFQRGGSIIPYKFRLRRSSAQMADDPFTLLVALGAHGTARGQLYFDDGTSFNYRKSAAFVHRAFVFANGTLTSASLAKGATFTSKAWLERVIVYGWTAKPRSVAVESAAKQSTQLQFNFDAEHRVLLIRKPAVNMAADWSLVISL